METTSSYGIAGIAAASLGRCTVVDVDGDGAVVVAPEGAEDILRCQLLHTGQGALALAGGDVVLVWRPDPAEESGVIVGRIGPSLVAPTAVTDEATPDELVIEATRSLTLRCGDGSITIREDGKILIKGKDLVSHAARMNRIRGGAVAIN